MVFEDTVVTKLKLIDTNTEATLKRVGKAWDRLSISATTHMKKAALLGEVYDRLDDKQKKVAGSSFKFQNTMMAGGAEAERLRARLMKLNETVDKQKGFFQRANAQIFRYRMAYISLAIGVMAVKRTLEATWEGLSTGARINEQISALDRLAAGYGTTADTIVDELTKVSKSTITTANIVQSAGKAMVMGISPEALTTLMRIATAAARTTGESVEKMFADITLGTARSSKKILDNIGIIVDWRAAYAKHAATLGVTVNMLDETAKKVARLNAIEEAGLKIVDTLNTGYDTQREKLDQLAVGVGNVADILKQRAVDFLIPLEGIEQLSKNMKDFQKSAGAMPVSTAERWANAIIAGAKAIRETVSPGLSGIKDVMDAINDSQATTLDLSKNILKTYANELKLQETIRKSMGKTQKTLNTVQKLLSDVTDVGKVELLRDRYEKLVGAIVTQKETLAELDDLIKVASANRVEYARQVATADETQKQALRETLDIQTKITDGFTIQRAKALEAFDTMAKDLPKIAKGITRIELEEQEKRLSGLVKLQERFVQEALKAEDAVTADKKSELDKRLLAVQRFYDAELNKIVEAEAKALEKIKEGSKAALEVHAEASKTRSELEKTRTAKIVQAETEAAKKVEALWKKSLETLGLDHSNFIEKQMSEALKAFGAIGQMGDLGTEDKIKALEGLRLKVNDIVEAIEPEKTLGIDTDTATQNLASFNVDLNQLFSDLERTATKTTKEIETTGDTLSIKLKSVAVDTNTFIANATASVTNLLKTNFTQLRNETITEGDLRKAVVTSNLEAMEQSVAKYASDFKQHEVDITTVIEQQFQKRMIALDRYIAGISSAQTNLLQLNPPPSLPGEFTGYTGSFASGLDLVPRDMTARIHKGERIQRADENPFNPAATSQDQRQDNRVNTFHIYQQPGESTNDLVDQLDAAMRLPGDFI